jgi:hypothetical protein
MYIQKNEVVQEEREIQFLFRGGEKIINLNNILILTWLETIQRSGMKIAFTYHGKLF